MNNINLRKDLDFDIIERILRINEVEDLELTEKLDLDIYLRDKNNFKYRESGSEEWKKLRGEMK